MNLTSTTTNIDFNSRMICVIDGDNILEVNNSGQTQIIGKTSNWCDELMKIANEYKQLCIDEGLIEEEKTAEQIQQEQMLLMQEMMLTMMSMKEEIGVLKNGHNETSITGCERTQSGAKQSKSSSKSGGAKSPECQD